MANRPAVVLSEVGFEGSGKSRLWLTAPKPIAAVSTDTNTETTARAYLEMGDDDDFDEDVLRFKQVNLPALAFDDRDDVKEEAAETWEAIRDFLAPMVKNKSDRPRTVVFDTATDVFDMRVLGEFGKTDQIPPEVRRNMMGRCNTSYKGIIQAFKDRGVHVILVHRAKDKWVDKERRTQRGVEETRERLTGPFDMEREAFKGTGFITSVEVNLAFDPNRDGKLSAKYGMKIARCNQRPGIIGREYWGREKLEDGSRIHRVSFPFLMSQVFPRVPISEWE